jgi:hypothetical protein
MLVSISTKGEYIPEWNKNRTLKGDEQIKVFHTLPSVSMKERLNPKTFTYGLDGDVQGKFEIDRKKTIMEFKVKIENLKVALTDGETKAILTGEDLFGSLVPIELDPLIDELYNYFNKILNPQVNTKN